MDKDFIFLTVFTSCFTAMKGPIKLWTPDQNSSLSVHILIWPNWVLCSFRLLLFWLPVYYSLQVTFITCQSPRFGDILFALLLKVNYFAGHNQNIWGLHNFWWTRIFEKPWCKSSGHCWYYCWKCQWQRTSHLTSCRWSSCPGYYIHP